MGHWTSYGSEARACFSDTNCRVWYAGCSDEADKNQGTPLSEEEPAMEDGANPWLRSSGNAISAESIFWSD